MSIENTEQAKIYINEVRKHLIALRHLSKDAGLNSHAAIWVTIEGAFLESYEEVKTITDMIGMYLEAKVSSMERDL